MEAKIEKREWLAGGEPAGRSGGANRYGCHPRTARPFIILPALFILLISVEMMLRQRGALAQEPATSLSQMTEIAVAGEDLAGVADHSGGLVLAYRPSQKSRETGKLRLLGSRDIGTDLPVVTGITEGSLVSIGADSAGFRRGEIFFGTRLPGRIARIYAETGRSYEGAIILPGETGIVTALAVDETMAFGGDLIAGTSGGNIWRIDGLGASRLIARIGPEVSIDSMIVAAGESGPLGGGILAVSRQAGILYRIDTGGQFAAVDIGIRRPAAIAGIPRSGNLYAVVTDSDGKSSLRGLSSRFFSDYSGGILIAQAADQECDCPLTLFVLSRRNDRFVIEKLAEPGMAGEKTAWGQLAFSDFTLAELEQQNGVIPFIGPFGNPQATGPTDANDDFTAIEVTVPKDDGTSADPATARFIVTLRNSGSAAGNIRIWAPAIPAGFTVNISLDSGATFTQLTSTQPLTLPTPVDPGEERNIDVRLIIPKGTPINAVYDLVLRADAAENPAAFNQTICRTKLLPPMPMLTLEKRAVDLDGGVLHPGDMIEYSLILGNYSSNPVTRAFVVDYLPPQLKYIEGSVNIVSGANAGPKSDAMDGDQVDYLPQAGINGQINIGVGAGAGGHANGFLVGGVMAPGESTTIVFRAMVREGVCCGTMIINGAEWGGDGVFPGGRSNLVQNIVRIANPVIGPFGDPGASGATGINDDMTLIRVNLDVSGGMTMLPGSVRFINTLQNNGTAAGRFIISAPVIPSGFTVRASVDSGATFNRLNDNGSVLTDTPLDPGEFRNLDLRVDYPVGLLIGQPYDIVLQAEHEDDARRTNQTIDRLVVDPNVPNLELRKGALDLKGRDIDGKTVYQGQELEYSLTLTNRSMLRVTRTFVTDFLPPGLSYVPGSTRITEGPNAGGLTDAVGDDQAEFLPGEGPNGLLTVYTGADASPSSGGALNPGESTTVVFRVRVDKDGLEGSAIRNFGEWGAEKFFTAGRSNTVENVVGGHCRATAVSLQPQAQTVCQTASATFQVVADGIELAYQWRKNGEPISGANSDTLTISQAGPNDAGLYDVVVNGLCGVATSEAAPLTLLDPPLITAHPASIQVTAWGDAEFRVEATGSGLTFQWRKNGQNIPGATSSIFSITSTRISDEGDYDVVVSGACGMKVSMVARLTINCIPTIPPLIRLPDGFVGVPYSHTVSLPAGNVTVAKDFVPPGLTFDTATGTLSGTPTSEGEFTFNLIWYEESGCPRGIFYRVLITKRELPVCSTLCFSSALYYSINFGTAAIPEGTVIIDGINGGAGIRTRDARVYLALKGFLGAMNREMVAFQLNILKNGGLESPGVVTAMTAQLSCYGIAFDQVAIVGRPVSPSIRLFDLLLLARDVASESAISQSRDQCLMAAILHALNGDSPNGFCNRTGGAISFNGCN